MAFPLAAAANATAANRPARVRRVAMPRDENLQRPGRPVANRAVRSRSGTRRPASVVRAASDRVVFRVHVPPPSQSPSLALGGFVAVRIPGYGPDGAAGEPAVPSRQFLVAIPNGARAVVSYRVLARRDLGVVRVEPVPFPVRVTDDVLGIQPEDQYRVDPRVYDAWRARPVAQAGRPGWIRHNRVLPVQIHPLVYDVRTGRAELATEIEVTIALSGARSAAASPTGGGGPVAVGESPLWENTFSRLLVNPVQARRWRTPTRARAAMAGAALARAALTRAAHDAQRTSAQPGQVRIFVRATRIHAVRASDAIAAGLPAGLTTDGVRLYQRLYDDTTMAPGAREIPFVIEEDSSGTPGVFDGADRLLFYGLRLRDDALQGDPIEKFADHNVYWLAAGTATPMQRRILTPAPVDADTAAAFFPVSAHFEIDRDFWDGIPPGQGNDFFFFNGGYETGPIDMPFTVQTVRPGATLTLTSEMHGHKRADPQRKIVVSLVNAKGTFSLASSYVIGSKNRQTFVATIPQANLSVGTNLLRLSRPASPSRNALDVLLNWVEVSYDALYRARGGALRFNTGAMSADTVITVTGLQSTDERLFDVSNPLAPVLCQVPAAAYMGTSPGWALSFRDTIGARKTYALVSGQGIFDVPAADLSGDTPSSIIGNAAESGVDVLVVSHADFIPQMQQWATYRRAQGYRVLLVDVQDVFDEFNNGEPAPRAIDRFTRRFYELGGAGTLVLVGDSSEDNKHVHVESGPNFVPTHSRAEHVNGLGLDEVVTTDRPYVKLPGPGGGVDVFPDLILGRLPVGSRTELSAVLDKEFRFERPVKDDFWRKRMIFVADDAWSVGATVFGGSGTSYQPAERAFETGQEQAAQVLERSLPAGYDIVRFYEGDYTRPAHPDSTKSYPMFRSVVYVRDNVTPLLMNELAKGATFVTIQAHMNRYLVAHEKLLSAQSANLVGGSSGGRDHLRVNNRGRPFVLFALGCHFSDYALHKELSQANLANNAPNGDSFSEQFLFASNRGAVATYGSSGFEYLGQTNDFMRTTARVWFYEAPYDTTVNQSDAQWIFGQMMFLVENAVAPRQSAPVERYHLLGDPLLRIDAGPPAFQVTVDGAPIQSGDAVRSSTPGQPIQVEAIVTDENAIARFSLEVAGVDQTDSLQVTPLVDTQLGASRQYRVRFRHQVRPQKYDIVLRAFQSPDTSGAYSMVAEFTLRVNTQVTVQVNGRTVTSGASVPGHGDYRVNLELPLFVPRAQVQVDVDSVAVTGARFTHPTPADSTTWIVEFSKSLAEGTHRLDIRAGASAFSFSLVVSSQVGLRDVLVYPNPYRDTANFVYTNDVEIESGAIEVFTTSGRRVRRLIVPPMSRTPGQNSVFWDGRDAAGDEVANGSYLYVIRVRQRGHDSIVRGAFSHLR